MPNQPTTVLVNNTPLSPWVGTVDAAGNVLINLAGITAASVFTIATAGTERVRVAASGIIASVSVEIDGVKPSVASNLGQLIIRDTSTTVAAGMGGQIAFGYHYAGVGGYANGAVIIGGKENAVSGDYAGYLAFATAANGGVNTEKVRINSAGNVGIGTNSPSGRLHVDGGILRVSNSALTTSNVLIYGGTDGSNTSSIYITDGTGAYKVYATSAGNGYFAGSLGIGTTGPSGLFHVAGAAGANAISYFTSQSGYSAYIELGATGQTAELQGAANGDFWLSHFSVAGGVLKSIRYAATPDTLVLQAGYVQLRIPATGVTDANLSNSQMAPWYDEANNRIAYRVKSSAGILKTGYVPVA